MKRVILISGLLILLSTAAWAQTQVATFAKTDIEFIKVWYRSATDKFYVLVGLNKTINGIQGFYYYDFTDLHEAVTFGDFFRRGRIKNVEHYTAISGKTATWYGKFMARIEKFGLK